MDLRANGQTRQTSQRGRVRPKVILPKYTRNFQSLPPSANSDLIKVSDIVFLSPDFQFVDHPATPRTSSSEATRHTTAAARPVFIPAYLRAHIEFRAARMGRNANPVSFLEPGPVVHYQSKAGAWDSRDQSHVINRLPRWITKQEAKFGHRRTVLVGDLNMNPFEDGVAGCDGLHAVMTRDIARSGGRTIDAVHRPFFYNPMWQFFGDRPGAPPGTHYFDGGGKPINFFWNMYDQVMVRPDLMDQLREVKILEMIGTTPLRQANGRPAAAVGSDHLPLFFVLEL
jgi:hypothetical protein